LTLEIVAQGIDEKDGSGNKDSCRWDWQPFEMMGFEVIFLNIESSKSQCAARNVQKHGKPSKPSEGL
jgi:hypothetical protein